METIVVTGATGTVGRLVVAGLLNAGCPVRAVSRRPQHAKLPAAAELMAGDLTEPATLEAAFAGAIQLMLVSTPETAPEIVERARRCGIEHIVLVSSAAVTAGYDTTYNLPVEQAVQASGLDCSIVRPGEFATNALHIWGPSIRTNRSVVEPFPNQTGSPIHEADIADVVLANLRYRERRGHIDTIIGPDILTKRDQVAAISAAVGEEVSLREVTPAQARDFYRTQGGFAAANADMLFGFESYDGVEGSIDEPHDTRMDLEDTYLTLPQVTGHPARSYAQWAREHAPEFT